MLVRVVIPAWVIAGAAFKLIDGSPRALPPATILQPANRAGLDLYLVVAAFASIELFAGALMILVRRFSRAVALAMLTAFCLVLINEIRSGSAACGCLGSHSPPPWAMLAIDGTLAAVVLALPRPWRSLGDRLGPPLLTAAVFGVVATVVSFAMVPRSHGDPGRDAPPPIRAPEPGGGASAPTATAAIDPDRNPDVLPPPAYWMTPNLDLWLGRDWREIPLFRYMERWPTGMGAAKRYVVFYSRTCDHCLPLFQDLSVIPIDAPVAAVEVPASKTRLRGDGAWTMPDVQCESFALPLGCEWIIQTPLVLTIEEGVITCAQEGDHRRCLGLP